MGKVAQGALQISSRIYTDDAFQSGDLALHQKIAVCKGILNALSSWHLSAGGHSWGDG